MLVLFTKYVTEIDDIRFFIGDIKQCFETSSMNNCV